MDKLPFVVWVMGWPSMCALSDYLTYMQGKMYDPWVETGAAGMAVFMWVAVAWLVWPPKVA